MKNKIKHIKKMFTLRASVYFNLKIQNISKIKISKKKTKKNKSEKILTEMVLFFKNF